ncbi:hypothetical protein N0V90_005936 [Kalmusia sp. IMI 367209]|nr:hypothetical protein N0V90_005936 [Kalmusia sp. IMI 367209]
MAQEHVSTLDYTCRCHNPSFSDADLEPDLSEYADTIPSLLCIEWQKNCIADNPNDSSAQQQCRDTAACGSRTAEAVVSVTVTRSTGSSQTSTNPSDPKLSAPSTQGSGTTSATPKLRSSDTASPTQATDTTNQNGNSTEIDTTPASSGGLGTGAKAGLAVGVIFGVLMIALVVILLRRRSKMKALGVGEPHEAYKPSNEKEVAIPVASEISKKPELYSEPAAECNSSRAYHQYANSGQWQQSQNPSELDSSNGYLAQLRGTADPVELRSSLQGGNVEPNAIPQVSPLVQTPYENSPPIPTSPASPHSPAPALGTRRPLYAGEIEALEEEERRIDTEIADVERMKELREQKFAIQQKLRDAR